MPICHEKKNQKPNYSCSTIKPPIKSMTLLSKLQELLSGTNPKRIKPLTDCIYNHISEIRDFKTLISDPFLPAFQLCWKQQNGPLSKFWCRCESKIIELINNPEFSNSEKRLLIPHYFPSPIILNTFYN
jgi:hypothetical protein